MQFVAVIELNSASDIVISRINKDVDVSINRINKDVDVSINRINKDVDVSINRINKDVDVSINRINKDVDVSINRINKDVDVSINRINKNVDVSINRGQDEQYNIWTCTDGNEPSKVSIKGERVYRPDMRTSMSIRDSFKMERVAWLNNIFAEYKIGIGHKHTYTRGNFMKPHFDGKLPDLDLVIETNNGKIPKKLPHIMTLLLIYNSDYEGGDFKIDGITIPRTNKFARAVLFSLDMQHEVTTIKKGIRHSFAFPIYGIKR